MRIIDRSEVVSLPRGRKTVYRKELLSALKSLKGNQWGVLETEFGSVPKEKRSAVGQTIRKHWAHVKGDIPCAIQWTPEGFPQVGPKESN